MCVRDQANIERSLSGAPNSFHRGVWNRAYGVACVHYVNWGMKAKGGSSAEVFDYPYGTSTRADGFRLTLDPAPPVVNEFDIAVEYKDGLGGDGVLSPQLAALQYTDGRPVADGLNPTPC